MPKYLSCAETASMIRKALKEAFPGVKFSVKSKTYSGGASISIGWTDGPNCRQVEAISNRFQGSYFDGMIDFKGSIYHMIDGQQVSMGADYIHTNRSYSDAAIQSAIDRFMRRRAGNLLEAGIEAPTVEDYQNGRLWGVRLPGLHVYGNESIQHDLNHFLYSHTYCLKVEKSPTAGKVMVTGDDGYSRQCGAGFSAVMADA